MQVRWFTFFSICILFVILCFSCTDDEDSTEPTATPTIDNTATITPTPHETPTPLYTATATPTIDPEVITFQYYLRYEDNINFDIYSIHQLDDNGYIVSGEFYNISQYDIFLARFDEQGHQKWLRIYGEVKYLHDRSSQLLLANDGGYYLCGTTETFCSEGNCIFLMKTDSNGNQEWMQTYEGYTSYYWISFTMTADGGFILAGSSENEENETLGAFLIKTDDLGKVQWSRNFADKPMLEVIDVGLTEEGNYFLAGNEAELYSYSAMQNIFIMNIDTTGELLWRQSYGGDLFDATRMVLSTDDGGYIAAAVTTSYGAGGSDMYLLKVSSTGTEEWFSTFGYSGPDSFGGSADCGNAVCKTSDGGYAVIGSESEHWKYWLVKTDSQGARLWDRIIAGAGLSAWYKDHYAIQQTQDGGYIIGIGMTLYKTDHLGRRF